MLKLERYKNMAINKNKKYQGKKICEISPVRIFFQFSPYKMYYLTKNHIRLL